MNKYKDTERTEEGVEQNTNKYKHQFVFTPHDDNYS